MVRQRLIVWFVRVFLSGFRVLTCNWHVDVVYVQWKNWCAVISVAEGESRVRRCGSVTVRVLVLECECESERLVWECKRGSSLECGSIIGV